MHPRQGGPPQVVVGSALALRRAGVDVEVAAMVLPGDEGVVRAARAELERHDIPLHLAPMDQPRALASSRDLARLVAEKLDRFDILHTHGVWEQALAQAGRAFHLAGKPYAVSAHGMLDAWSLSQSRLKKTAGLRLLGTGRFLKRADAIIYGTADEAREAGHLGFGPARVIPNGIDLDRIETAGDRGAAVLAAHLQVGDWRRTILFFSRIHPKKGLDLLVEAFAKVAADFPQAGLLAAGIAEDETYLARIHQRIAELGLQCRIVVTTAFTGAAGRGAFDLAQIFALPSHQEGFSMAILEALALGKPILITDKCHLNEAAAWGVGEVTPDTVAGLEAGLRRLLASSDEALGVMGRNGKEIVSARYTWDAVGASLIQLYEALAARSKGPPR